MMKNFKVEIKIQLQVRKYEAQQRAVRSKIISPRFTHKLFLQTHTHILVVVEKLCFPLERKNRETLFRWLLIFLQQGAWPVGTVSSS